MNGDPGSAAGGTLLVVVVVFWVTNGGGTVTDEANDWRRNRWRKEAAGGERDREVALVMSEPRLWSKKGSDP